MAYKLTEHSQNSPTAIICAPENAAESAPEASLADQKITPADIMNGLATNQNGIHPFCAVSAGPSNKEGFLNPFSDNYRFEICFSFEFENLISNSGEEFGDGAEQVTQQAVSP